MDWHPESVHPQGSLWHWSYWLPFAFWEVVLILIYSCLRSYRFKIALSSKTTHLCVLIALIIDPISCFVCSYVLQISFFLFLGVYQRYIIIDYAYHFHLCTVCITYSNKKLADHIYFWMWLNSHDKEMYLIICSVI